MMKLSNILRLNWTATVGINYKIGGIQAVLRMPVKVYGKLKWHISGSIILPDNAIRSTLVVGSSHEDYTASSGRAELNIKGTWKINGIVCIGYDSFVGVKSDAVLEMGDGCMIARDSQIHCSEHITFGKDVFAGELYVTDCSEHQIISQGKEKPMTAHITIGDGTYLGFRCMLLKGTNIPPRSVVASGAVCTKDYTTSGSEQLFIAGVPACVKAQGITALK